VEAYEQAMEQEQKEDEATALAQEQEDQHKRIMAAGMTPSNTPLHFPNTSINIAEMYGGMTEESNLV